jgi:PKD repeat protein
MTKVLKAPALLITLVLVLSLGMVLLPQAGLVPKALASPDSLGPVVTETGFISLSLDALGVNTGTPGTIQVDKPSGATVRAAYMAAADVWGSQGGPLPDGAVTLEGTSVSWSLHEAGNANHAWADVTSIVKPVVDAAPAGIVDLTVVETIYMDGSILAVIFDDPNQTVANTVILLFGAQSTGGDTFSILLTDPIDLSDPDFGMDFSLGIAFGWQGSSQYSIVDVNSTRLTTSAGGQDDGYSADGGLITVGGIGDSTTNPPDPYQTPTGSPQYRYDDELYDLLPFVDDGDTNVEIDTVNPSGDDSIFFAALFMKSATGIIGEGIILEPATATNEVGTEHTVTATVQNESGEPAVGVDVTFTVTDGPHEGVTGIVTTGSDGTASFSYTGITAGTDTIIASFLGSSEETITSNEVTKEWGGEAIPVRAAARVSAPIGEAPHQVQFYDMSTGDIDEWFWEFGDGSSSTAQYPTHTYQNGGTYQICLTVEGPGGSDTACIQVIVEEGPAAPNLVVRNLYISATQAKPRQQVVITADVFNEGGAWGSGEMQLLINGYYEQSAQVGVAPGTAQPISFTVYKVPAGEYQVTIGNATGTFYVVKEQQTSQLGSIPMDSGTLIALIVIGVFVIAALIVVIVILKPS